MLFYSISVSYFLWYITRKHKKGKLKGLLAKKEARSKLNVLTSRNFFSIEIPAKCTNMEMGGLLNYSVRSRSSSLSSMALPLKKEPIHFLHKPAHLSTIPELRILNLDNNSLGSR